MKKYILALDQGTTSSRAILFDQNGALTALAQNEFPQHYPRPGWVEHDAGEIWESQSEVALQVLKESRVHPRQVAAIGITSQRETTLVWNRHSGQPICPAIVWQCRRTDEMCEQLKKNGWTPRIQEKTGLVVDAYFSATKLKWILDNIPGARAEADHGDLLFGTVDCWLIWNLTRGQVHATDYSNASRTMLYNIHDLEWDAEILGELDIPAAMLPQVKPSSGIFGETDPSLFDGQAIPIAGNAGDQQAALFGQTCFTPGSAKNTYGTGCFLLLNTGSRPTASHNGLLTTIAWKIAGQPVQYALEGSIFTAGSVIQWLRDEMRIIDHAAQSEEYAAQVPDTHGVYLVPAFTGLGAPYWDMYARGTITGLTRGARREHIVRAALEAIAYQTRDVCVAMQQDSGIAMKHLQVDGGAAANSFLLQFQADILGVPVRKPAIIETTALGAAWLAGLAVGLWRDQQEICDKSRIAQEFKPTMAEEESQRLYQGWQRAVAVSIYGHSCP